MAEYQGKIAATQTREVATIEFYHPASNSLPSHLLKDLAETIERFGKNENIKVIVLKSSGERAFCAGASFDELLAIADKKTGEKFFSGFANVINAMRQCPKFIIGRVHGKTVGGGVGLAAAVDYCFATNHAAIKLSELSIGIGPFVIGPAVIRKIGMSSFSQLSIQATQWKSPQWALEKGLFHEVFESTEAMDSAIVSLAQQLSKSNPEAMRKMKKMFWKGTKKWGKLLTKQAKMSGELILSDFTKEALLKFKSKG